MAFEVFPKNNIPNSQKSSPRSSSFEVFPDLPKTPKPLKPAGTTQQGFRQLEAQSQQLKPSDWALSHPKTYTALNNAMKPVSKVLSPLLDNPWAQRAGQTGAEVMTMTDQKKATTGSKLGDISADIAGNLMGFVTNPEGGVKSLGSNLWKGAEDLGSNLGRIALPKLAAKTPGVAKAGANAVLPSVAYEATQAGANDRPASGTQLGESAAANAIIAGVTHGLLRGRIEPVKNNLAPTAELPKAPTTSELGVNPLQQAAKQPMANDAASIINDLKNIVPGVEHAPEALEKPDFQAANTLAKTISGREIIPFKGTSGFAGAQTEGKILLNADMKEPVLYIANHEIAHTIKANSPETYSRLEQIVREHVADSDGLRTHYESFGYKPEDIPNELTADAMAESMLEPTFWAKVRNQAPELLQPVLDAIDNVINTVKQKAGEDMTIAPYLKDLETMRDRLANEYRGYLADVQSGKVQLDEADLGNLPDTSLHIASKTTREFPAAKALLNKTYSSVTDDLQRLNQFDKAVQNATGKELSAQNRSYTLAMNSRGADQVARTILEDNLVDSQGNKIGDSLKSVYRQIPKGQERAFEDYLINRHAPSWMVQGRKVFPESMKVTPQISAAKAAQYEAKNPQFKALGDQLVNWQRQMGKAWLVDTGIISPEAWQKFIEMYPDYIPLQRSMKDIEQGGGFAGAKRGFANQTNPIKKATGSERQIISPLESIIEHVDRYVKTAKRNEVMQTVIRNLQQDPEGLQGFAKIVPTEQGLTEDINRTLMNDGIEGVMDKFNQPFDEAFSTRKNLNRTNVVSGFVNGERVHVEVNDPAMLDALTNLKPQAQNVVVNGFRQATRVMKMLTTGINPVFSLGRNIFRDLPMSYIASKTTNNPLVWGRDIIDSFARVITNEKWHATKYYGDYRAMGGGHSSSIASDRNLLRESKANLLGKNTLSTVAKAPLAPLERIANAVETIPRLPEYMRTVKAGGNTYSSRIEGVNAAQDVTVNFSKHGGFSKDVDAFIPYFNAAIQGIDKLARIYKENPVQAIIKSLGAITLPTMYLYSVNHNNPNYNKLSNYIKDNNFCIPLADGTFLKIPKPREAGVIFGSIVERAMREWRDNDPDGFNEFGETVKTNFAPPARSILAPINDVRANKDYLDRPIVPGYMENLSPKNQFDENTSTPAKALGGLTNTSPKKIDYLIRSYGGVLGQVGLPAAAQGRGQSTLQRTGETIKRQFIVDPLYSNDVMNNFYDAKDKLDKAAADYRYTKSKPLGYDPFKQRAFNKLSTQISDVRKEMRQINNNKSLPYDEKQLQTRKLQQHMLDLAQKGLNLK